MASVFISVKQEVCIRQFRSPYIYIYIYINTKTLGQESPYAWITDLKMFIGKLCGEEEFWKQIPEFQAWFYYILSLHNFFDLQFPPL